MGEDELVSSIAPRSSWAQINHPYRMVHAHFHITGVFSQAASVPVGIAKDKPGRDRLVLIVHQPCQSIDDLDGPDIAQMKNQLGLLGQENFHCHLRDDCPAMGVRKQANSGHIHSLTKEGFIAILRQCT